MVMAPKRSTWNPRAGNDRVAVAVEVRVEAADGEHELAAIGALEPRHEREPPVRRTSGSSNHELSVSCAWIEEHALAGREAADQTELDRHQRELRTWEQGHAGQPEQRQLEPVADRDGDDRHAVDESEAVEADAGREPELTLQDGEGVLVLLQDGHRVRRRLGTRVERLDERERAELSELGREHQPAVDAEAAADAGEEERRRSADGAVHRSEGEEAGELATVGRPAHPVATEHRQAVHAEAGHEHADVLDGVGLVRTAGRELAQAADERDAAEVAADGEAGQVDGPSCGVEERRVRRGDEGDGEVVDRRREAEDRHPSVEQQRDRLEVALLDLGVEADLLDVRARSPSGWPATTARAGRPPGG